MKITIFLILITIPSLFSYSIIDNDDLTLSLHLYSETSIFYDNDAATSEGEDEISFGLGKNIFGFRGDCQNIEYSLLTEFKDSEFILNEALVKYRFNPYLSINAGYNKIPFGRAGLISDSEFLLWHKNPLLNYLYIERSFGMAISVALDEGKYLLDFGMCNNKDTDCSIVSPKIIYCGTLHLMPLGKIENSESSVMGYDKFLIDIVPSIYYMPEEFDYTPYLYELMPNVVYGINIAGRYSYLAFDAMIYSFGFYEESDMTNNFGYSAQLAYAFMGKIEPCIRFSNYGNNLSICNLIDSSFNNFKYTECNLEIGTSYYLKKQNSQVGLYYRKRMYDIDDEYYKGRYRDVDEFRVFLKFSI